MSKRLNRTLSHRLAETYAAGRKALKPRKRRINIDLFLRDLDRWNSRNLEYEEEIQAFIDRTVGTTSRILTGARISAKGV